jgi:pSer/pThr/pTyr-binding forkhead associated (FHA) protein
VAALTARLTLYPAGRVPRFVLLRDGESLEVGRDPLVGVLLEDTRVSKHHARVLWAAPGWAVEDLHSKNGTTLNGRTLGEEVATLHHGDWLSFGGLAVRFEKLTALQAATLESDRLVRNRTSAEMRRSLTAALDPSDLLVRFVSLALQVTRAERGFLIVFGSRGEMCPEVVVGFTRDDLVAPEFLWSVRAVKRVLGAGEPLIVSEALQDPRLRDKPTVAGHGIRLAACLPLRVVERPGVVIGVVYVDRLSHGGDLSVLDVETLETLAGHTGTLLAASLKKRGMPWTETSKGPLRTLFRSRIEELLPIA